MSLLHELQVTLIETQEPKLRDLAMRLGNPKNQTEIRQRKLRKELYEVLGSIIDSESYYLIVMATKRIEKITNKITANVGWFASRKGITEIEGEIETYTEFPEIVKGRRLYHLDRDETGFHVQNDEVPSNGLLKSIREAEIKFAKEKKEELELLHQMYPTDSSTVSLSDMSLTFQMIPITLQKQPRLHPVLIFRRLRMCL